MSTLSLAAVSAALGSCALWPMKNVPGLLPPPPTPLEATGFVQVGQRIDGTLRFVACTGPCPGPTPKVPITEADLLAVRALDQARRDSERMITHGTPTSPEPPTVVTGLAEASEKQYPGATATAAAAAQPPPAEDIPSQQRPVLISRAEVDQVAAQLRAAVSVQRGAPVAVNVLFENNSAVLNAHGRLQVLFAAHYAPDGSLLSVKGRTDARTDNPVSRSLAAARAKAVAAALERAGVNEDRIKVSYRAAGDWVDGRNSTPAQKSANRRAIIAIRQGDPGQHALESGNSEPVDEALNTRIALALAR